MLRFLLPVAALFLISLGLYIRSQIQRYRLGRLGWDQLLEKLQPTQVPGIERIALDHLHPQPGQLRYQPADIWERIGGLEGLMAMYENCRILCALASYAERWNYEEAAIVTMRIRRDALKVRWAVLSVAIGIFLRRGRLLSPFHILDAASAYYLMRQRLLALYQTSHAGRYPQLAAAL